MYHILYGNPEFDEALYSTLAVNGISLTFNSVLSIAVYVLTALALYSIAKRRGISKPWLAWIPVLSVWTLGSISDQYRYVVKGENKSKRKALLILNIILFLLSVAVVILAFAVLGVIFAAAVRGGNLENELDTLMGIAFGMLGVCLPMLGVSIAYMIIYFMALYDVYTSLDPSNNVLFLVLSVLFSVTTPFFLFFNRNKDGGMPPRRPAPSACFPEEVPTWQNAPVEEPWNHPDHE